jgi:polar amino acid transport system ATP-binding protein
METSVVLTEPLIAFTSVTKRFGPRVVLNSLDLNIPHGQKLAIIGPSGSGKSTILRILMTLETIESGSVRVGNEYLWRDHSPTSVRADESTTSAIRRRIGMVFQQFNLFPHMTVLQNVSAAPIKVLRKPKDIALRNARDLLTKVGLSDKMDAYPGFLSGGQQQRVRLHAP